MSEARHAPLHTIQAPPAVPRASDARRESSTLTGPLAASA